LKTEEKMIRKQSQKNKGRGPIRSKGKSSHIGGFQTPRDKGIISSSRGRESR